jgi:hypothetical protein
MKHSIWMAAWDLAGREPGEVIAFLRNLGLDACNLALSYHGGRMLLPMNRSQVVYEQHPGALYFPADLSRYKSPLSPEIACEASLVVDFLLECRRSEFPVWAWTVLCHNDYLGPLAADCCIRNAFGECYTYALCPSHPAVREYAVTLCAEIAALPGIVGLDLEALGFLGYEHASLHNKSGITIPSELARLLSICFCPNCRRLMGSRADELAAHARDNIRATLAGDNPASVPNAGIILDARRQSQLDLLRAIRAACPNTLLNLRLALDPWFFGGKSTLDWGDLADLVDAATVTFFGQAVNAAAIPVQRAVPLHTGFVFHAPDCASEADVRQRYGLLRSRAPEQINFYSFSMASNRHFDWLRQTLTGETR